MEETATLLLLFSDREPVRVPVVVGTKVTLMVQLAPAASVAPQELVCAKSPEAVIPLMVRGPSPVLVKVTTWALLALPTNWFAKLRLAGDQAATGVVPVPVRLAEGAVLVKSPDTVMEPLRLPCAVGAKDTLMVHVAPTARVAPQLLDWAKSPVA